MIGARADLTVERARVLRAAPDSRAHLENALARVSPAAVGVPSGALLVIRRLAPRARLGPGMRADAFVADLHETLRKRVAHARSPCDAREDDDLLFRDDAELAAAVIASWLDGSSPEARRWQRIATGGERAPIWWRRRVLTDPRLLPRVIAALARQERAAAWLAILDPGEVRHAVHMLAAAHGAVLAYALWPGTSARAQVSHARRREAQAAREALRATAPEAASPALSEPARTLLALALTLDRRPALVRTPAFAPGLAMFVAQTPADSFEVLPGAIPQVAATRRLAETGAATRPADERPSIALTTVPPPSPVLPATPPFLAPRPHTAIETDFGGVFFLLNALLAMEVYGDFTRPLAVADAPSPFDLLALLGRRWFGARFRRDQIDPFLAALAGRAPDEPLRFSRRWIAALSLDLEARLGRALDVPGRVAVRMTCRQPASLALDGDVVTLTFTLATHPLALRLAGLDRDPGYIPAARREVAFVFA